VSRILLVDDDIAEISSVKRVLLRGGHQPALATNASDAMAAIDGARPELLIVSATCENGEALSMARQLADGADGAAIRMLLLGDVDDLPEGARRLSRPLDPEQLLAEVNATLGARGGIDLEEPAAPRPATAAPKPRPASAPVGKVQPTKALVPPPPGPAVVAPGARPAAPGPRKPATPPAGATALSGPLPPTPLPGPTRTPPPGAEPAARPASGLADAAASRRAAADALRARAEELRRAKPDRKSVV
jgi:CheY-like chemotaxis protein